MASARSKNDGFTPLENAVPKARLQSRSGNFSLTGFTYLEMLIVISIIILFASFIITYNHISERQLIIIKDQARIVGALQKAKANALATFSDSGVSCGFGVRFSTSTIPNQMIIFKNTPLTTSTNTLPLCLAMDHSYQPLILSSTTEVIYLDPDIRFSNVGSLDIFFVPPDPTIFIDNSSSTPSSLIEIVTVDGLATKAVKINNFGQITIQ